MSAKRADIAPARKPRAPANTSLDQMPSYRQSDRPAAFALVADDYALTEGVSRSILDLSSAAASPEPAR